MKTLINILKWLAGDKAAYCAVGLEVIALILMLNGAVPAIVAALCCLPMLVCFCIQMVFTTDEEIDKL